MSTSSENNTSTEVDQSGSELARTKKVQEDLWSHDIYLNARRKITTGVVAVLAIVGLASGGALYNKFTEISDRLEDFALKEMENTLTIQVNETINKMIKEESRNFNKKLNMEIDKFTKEMTEELNESKKLIDERVSNLNKKLEEAEILTILANKSTVSLTQILDRPAQDVSNTTEVENCNSRNLTLDQTEMISVKQQVEETETYSSGDRRYYKNIFTIVSQVDNEEMSGPVADCIVDGVDRVVYKLSERWFKQSEFSRYERGDDFRFSMKVWGSTPVNVDIHLKGRTEPLTRKAKFLAGDSDTDKPRYFNR